MEQSKFHWEKIYSSKQSSEMSWTQDMPQISLDFVHAAHPDKKAKIIDIGGGDSKLVDFLIDEKFEDITVLDISEEALKRAQKRLGIKSEKVTWVVSDITEFEPAAVYDIWHDRAAFHFLTTASQIRKYLSIARKAVKTGGTVIIGVFSEKGPKKCSGLDVMQYSEETLSGKLQNGFEKINCITQDHKTPFNTIQHFLFCSFRRI
ncbi:MAG TPA: class I SAM-dependent methyltransferase [Puia sp.]|nr:class I SAM-dependent methyltransferase [Puia sp.]